MNRQQIHDGGPVRAVVYCRVASKKAGGPDHLDEQARRCRDHAYALGYEVTECFSDYGSGIHAERPGMRAMLDHLQTTSAQGPVRIIVDDAARIARDAKTYFGLRRAIADAGGTIEIVQPGPEREVSAHAHDFIAITHHSTLRRQP